MPKVRRFKKYSVGTKNVDEMTREQLLNQIRIGLKPINSPELLGPLINRATVELSDMPVEMLRELFKDYLDACDDRLKAEKHGRETNHPPLP